MLDLWHAWKQGEMEEWFLFLLWRCDPTRVMTSSFLRFLDHTQRRSTVGRTPLDEWSARHRDLYLTTHNTHNRQTSMLPVGFEPTISAGERPQTYALDRAATGTGNERFWFTKLKEIGNFQYLNMDWRCVELVSHASCGVVSCEWDKNCSHT